MQKELHRLPASERIWMIADKESFKELHSGIHFYDPLNFKGYEERVKLAEEKTGLKEAVVTGRCSINGYPCVLIVMDSHFMMGSMGSVAGEMICAAFEYAAERKLPVITFAASGGARMQEGVASLAQMAKTAGAVKEHSDKGLLYVSVITDPTLGGVSASFASLADIIIAEPQAVYGFTGRRIIQDTIMKELPEDFQSSESAMKHGAIDMIVERDELKPVLGELLKLHIR
ncbi:MAG: acetyl-CoA carboxylase carboxyl transferase subunit beta [Clostridiales bacterium]|jgi:acetyl-CoA carboxylase carboxyl transferase subunit beta|nr:acetyl-CoA carboxylase carboxyl transferase subunit beta [Clostridiales bacterium]